MNRLSGFDAGLLALESPCRPMNACTLYVLDTSTIPGAPETEFRVQSEDYPGAAGGKAQMFTMRQLVAAR